MKKTFGFYLALVVCSASSTAVSADKEQADGVVNVGNEPNDSISASGIAVVNVRQGSCKYSLDISKDQYIKFNTPDVVFLESKSPPKDQDWPHLEQAEMAVGYDWSFKKDSNLGAKWFGMMCDVVDNFDLKQTGEDSGSEDVSPELQDVRQANALKCPATLSDERWLPNKSAGNSEDYIFQELRGSGWSGFIFGFKDKTGKKIARVSFCILEGENMLVGAAENYPDTLTLDAETFQGIRDVLSSLRFSK
ncbi:hypothetical protein [Pseudomonas sp. RA_15y_Pfl2_54]|uniref:hypothetical protein n=1 Tax=Pseudomonas sp. RA_15y_Pfl2_54 TaxID=3088704 RepID=UPI0030D84975